MVEHDEQLSAEQKKGVISWMARNSVASNLLMFSLILGGLIFSGANVENASYSVTSCAETSAIAALASAGEREIEEVVIVGPGLQGAAPCGRCRQAIREFANDDTEIHIAVAGGEIVASYTMEELLPNSFGPSNLK